jgi:hypothetical protein
MKEAVERWGNRLQIRKRFGAFWPQRIDEAPHDDDQAEEEKIKIARFDHREAGRLQSLPESLFPVALAGLKGDIVSAKQEVEGGIGDKEPAVIPEDTVDFL